jgi:sugar/nucleoside kinase (ribokinase family)
MMYVKRRRPLRGRNAVLTSLCSGRRRATGKQYDIICVGIANISVSIRPVDREVFETDVTLIDPVEAGTGGDAMNEAMTAARLGSLAGLVSKVGNDLFGRMLLDAAREAGVSTDHVTVSEAARTAAAVLLINGNGERNICAYRGAFESLCLEDIDISVFDRAKIVTIGSMFALRKLDGDGVKTILERAKNAGSLTGADVKYDTYKLGFSGIKHVFPYLDFFLPNYEEALYLTAERDPSRQCEVLMDAGCATVIIKLGREGCYLAWRGGEKLIPPCPARRVDTTGAGDNFVAGFLTGVNRGLQPEEAARFANATAAVSIQEVGSNGAVKSFAQVMEHARKNNYL